MTSADSVSVLEIRVIGTGERLAPVVLDVARNVGLQDKRLREAKIQITDDAATQTVVLWLTPRVAETPEYVKTVLLPLRELPQKRSLVRIPEEEVWETTAGTSLRQRFVDALTAELKRLGFISGRSSFKSSSVLDTAVTQLSSGHSERQTEGLDKVVEGVDRVIDGVYTFEAASLHRKNPIREEAELCVTLATVIFDSFALMVPA